MTEAVVVLVLALVSCDSQEQAKKPEAPPSTLCGVQLTAGPRAALLNLVGGKELEPTGTKDSLSDTAQALVSGYRENGADDYEKYGLCTAFGASPTAGADFSFYLSEEVPKSISPKFTQYELGELALSRPSHAVLYMNCASTKFGSADKPVLIEGDLTNAQAPSTDPDTVREENLNVLHVFSLALAKELGCDAEVERVG